MLSAMYFVFNWDEDRIIYSYEDINVLILFPHFIFLNIDRDVLIVFIEESL